MEKVYRHVKDREEGLRLGGQKVQMLAYADDVDILMETEGQVISFAPSFLQIGERLWLIVNQDKTKFMRISRHQRRRSNH